MTSADDPSGPANTEAADKLLDLFLYAPIGLVLDADLLAPDLARRGRQHSAVARQIGELVVKKGLKRLDEVMAQAPAPNEPTTENAPAVPLPEEPEVPVGGTLTSSHLAIPEYDLLAASQVVKRLDSLASHEIEDIRAYETSTRDRRTILHKIARLQG